MIANIRGEVGKEKLLCEEKFNPLQSAVRKAARINRVFGDEKRLSELVAIESAITDIRRRIRDIYTSNETGLLKILIGLKCIGNVAQSSVPKQLSNIDEIIKKVSSCLEFCNEILSLINMNIPSTEEFIHYLCQKIKVKPRFLMNCCDGLFDSLPFISGDENLMANCLKIFFETYLQQKETVKLKEFYEKVPERIRSRILKKEFLKKIAEKIADEDLNITFDKEHEKLVRIDVLLKSLREYLKKKEKLNLKEVSGTLGVSLKTTIHIVLMLLKEELEEETKIYTTID